ncbi:hypothetical protein PRZ48_000195 [Zasmidium cellare]|uniref:Heterokaryon incompatibility domain-containing protein n=1 Tax=Zasmidium cellare TaxID=395010 RepID=A0ABR0EZ20_ZASCE|nr:hypothetical protein PRZ48_000195 [Zasmidium cellare]
MGTLDNYSMDDVQMQALIEHNGDVQTSFNYYNSREAPPINEIQPLFSGKSPRTSNIATIVHDLRQQGLSNYNVDRDAFQILKHSSSLLPPRVPEIADFHDETLMRNKYWPELSKLLKDQLGVRSAVAINTTVRDVTVDTSVELRPDNPRASPRTSFHPFFVVHGDYTPAGARAHMRAMRPSFFADNGCEAGVPASEREEFFRLRDEILRGENDAMEAEGVDDIWQWSGRNYAGPRWAMLSVWRPFETVHRDPLGILLGSNDRSGKIDVPYVPFPRVYKARPGFEAQYASENCFPLGPEEGERHVWGYVSEQKNDEILVLKLFDCEAEKEGKCLELSLEVRERGFQLGTYPELLQRTRCGFCQLVLEAVSEATEEARAPEQQIGALLYPGEQSLRLLYPSRVGTRLAFIADDALGAAGPDNARLPAHGSQGPLVKSWLQACATSHPDCSLESIDGKAVKAHSEPRLGFNESATSNFRLIDLEQGCVKHSALDERFVALSYVWGNLPMFMLNKENFDQLSTPGSIDSVRSELPKTVNDVIDFVKAIGERYLWIDGLCLVQDDHEDVLLGIQMMNSIYHGAYCTIVAASGEDANAGLIVSGNDPVVKEVAPGVKMTIQHSVEWYLNRSKYNTRGWTLQELVLSRRTIVFMNGQLHFRCRTANWSEDTWADQWATWRDPDDSNITRIPGLMDGLLAHLWPYQKLCEEFSSRTLRRDGDALRATAGITRTLAAGMETCLVEGLPGYYLDHFLLFISANGDLERRPEFGSFSWAGWNGRIMWPRENFAWYNEQSERTWEVDNILKYFEHNRIVAWNSINRNASLNELSSTTYARNDFHAPSPLLRLMREYPSIFEDLETDPVRDMGNPRCFSSHGSHGDMPMWGVNYDDDERLDWMPKKGQYKKGFSIKGFDLLNGQAEFDRMVQHVENPLELLTLQNWQACRRVSIGQAYAEEGTSRFGPRPTRSGKSSMEQFAFREPVRAGGKRKRDRRHEMPETFAKKGGPPVEVPDFPPYDILQCKATSALSRRLDRRSQA